jgi:hypothetical protein
MNLQGEAGVNPPFDDRRLCSRFANAVSQTVLVRLSRQHPDATKGPGRSQAAGTSFVVDRSNLGWPYRLSHREISRMTWSEFFALVSLAVVLTAVLLQ